jgi:hypothetical protein
VWGAHRLRVYQPRATDLPQGRPFTPRRTGHSSC